MNSQHLLPKTTSPSWPSLYNLALEITPVVGVPPVQPGGHYLIHPGDVFRFTFYWSLVFYAPAFVLSGTLAFINLLIPPSPLVIVRDSSYDIIPITDLEPPRRRKKLNKRRSRLSFSLLVIFGFLVFGMASAVVSSLIVAYILVGVFVAGKFYMSTWIPLIWAMILICVGFLGVWPSVIDII